MRNSFVKILSGTVLTMAAFCPLSAENLLKNGSMENGTAEWLVPSWLKNTVHPVSDTSITAGGGKASLKLQGEKGKRAIVYHNFVIPAGCKYLQIRLMVKTKNLGYTYSAAYLEVQNVKKSLWAISTYDRGKNKVETGWMEYVSPVIELPANAGPMAKIYLHMDPKAQGTVWFDDVSITPLKSKADGIPPVDSDKPEAKKKTVNKPPVADLGTPSGKSILTSGWTPVTWLPDAAPFKSSADSVTFRIKAGQRGLTQQRVMGIAANVTGNFRYSALVKAPAGIFPVMNVLVRPVYTAKGKPFQVHCKPCGTKDGFQKFECYFSAPSNTGEISASVGISGKSSKDGEVIFKELKLEPLTPRDDHIRLVYAWNDDRQGLFYPDETPFAMLQFQNFTLKKQTLTLDCSLRDIRGNIVQKFTRNLELPAKNISNHKIEFPRPERLGFYSVHLQWNSLKEKKTDIVSFAMVSRFKKKKDPFFGVTFMAHNAQYATAMERLANGSKGLFISWSSVEEFNGTYNWEQADRDLEALERAGIEPIGGIEISTHNVPFRFLKEINERKARKEFPFSDAFLENAMKFERALFARYRGRIKHWAIIGEIDLLKQRNYYEYEYYIRRIKNCSRVMREVAPENTLAGIGCSGGDGRVLPRYPVLRDLWYNHKLSDYLDGLGIDQYTNPCTFGPGYKPINSETGMIRDIMLEALRIARSKGKNKFISIDEKGFNIVQSLPVDSHYAVDMAENIARDYITVKSIPEVQHYLYFMWKRWRLGDEFDWGMWYDRFPRPKAAVYAATARILANAKCVKVMSLHSNIPCYIFDNGDIRIIPLWHGGTGVGKAGVTLKKVPRNLTMLDMQGNAVSPVVSDGSLRLQLDSAPVYLQTTEELAELEKILREAVVELPAVRVEMILKRADLMEVLVKNLFSVPVNGTLSMKNRFADFRKNYTVQGNGILKLQIPLKNQDAANLSGVEFTVENISAQKQVYRKTDAFHIHGIPRISSKSQLTSGKPVVDLSNGELYLNIPDMAGRGVWSGPEDCSAKLYMGYDEKNLYMTIVVRDEIHTNRHTSEDALWAGDSLQFAFDPNLDAREKLLKGKRGLFGDDFFLTAGLAGGKPVMFCHINGTAKADFSTVKPVITRNETQKTTTYEITLPWSKMAPMKPQKGLMFGFNFLIMDTDNPQKFPTYWMQLTPGIAGGKTPEKYHIFVLK